MKEHNVRSAQCEKKTAKKGHRETRNRLKVKVQTRKSVILKNCHMKKVLQ